MFHKRGQGDDARQLESLTKIRHARHVEPAPKIGTFGVTIANDNERGAGSPERLAYFICTAAS